MSNPIITPVGSINVVMVNGNYYWVADKQLRDQVENWSASGSLDPDDPDYNPDGFVSASTILAKFAEEHNFTVDQITILDTSKLDKSTYETLLATLQEKRIAFTASYNDLVDVPSFGGARVSGNTLIFSGSSSGQEAYLLEQLDLTAGVIGTGVL